MSSVSFPRNNNLEWLRLIFAAQVLLEHSGLHLGTALPDFVRHFPGVPAFFFVSGFLIYASYLNAPGWRYFENRFLRLYPGLVFVTLGGVAVVLMADGWGVLRENPLSFLVWFVAQTTLGQAYNPALFRDVGVGVINGSLWTITTEILFYISVPVIVRLERRFRPAVVVLMGLSFALYVAGPSLLAQKVYRDQSAYDVLALTPLVWGWMFGIGILTVKYFHLVRPHLRWLPVAAVPLAAMIVLGDGVLFGAAGNRLGLVYFLCYLSLVFYAAFALPYVRLPFDLSYGIYVWHMPVINALLVLRTNSVSVAIVSTVLIAAFSWFFVEKPMLKRKHRSLRTVEVGDTDSAAKDLNPSPPPRGSVTP